MQAVLRAKRVREAKSGGARAGREARLDRGGRAGGPGPQRAASATSRQKHEKLVENLVMTSPDGRPDGSLEWRKGMAALGSNLKASIAGSTATGYAGYWNRFVQFCEAAGRVTMPYSQRTAAVFLSYLAEEARGLGGVDLARAALRYYFVLAYPELSRSPVEGEEVTLVMRGIKRRWQKPVSKKAPLEKKDFFKFLKTATNDGRLCQLRLAAQVSLMYLTFSRFEESSGLKINQVMREGKDLVVMFEKGKTYQYGEARMAVMASQSEEDWDPVKIVGRYIGRLQQVPGNHSSWLFPAVNSSKRGDSAKDKPASYNSVLEAFRNTLVEAKVTSNPSEFGLHSMRRGAATAAVNNGASDHAVRKQMRVATVGTVHRYATVNSKLLAATCDAVFAE
jgi:integrase